MLEITSQNEAKEVIFQGHFAIDFIRGKLKWKIKWTLYEKEIKFP